MYIYCCIYSKDGEFHRSLDTVHGLLSVNSDHSHRDSVEEEQARIAAVQTGTKPFVVNGNNTLLWEVNHCYLLRVNASEREIIHILLLCWIYRGRKSSVLLLRRSPAM